MSSVSSLRRRKSRSSRRSSGSSRRRASIARYQNVLRKYPDYTHLDEVIFRLGEAFAATAQVVGDHHFDAVLEAYLEDPQVREFLADFGPAIALVAMTAVAASPEASRLR